MQLQFGIFGFFQVFDICVSFEENFEIFVTLRIVNLKIFPKISKFTKTKKKFRKSQNSQILRRNI